MMFVVMLMGNALRALLAPGASSSWLPLDGLSWGVVALATGAAIALLVDAPKPARWSLLASVWYLWYFGWLLQSFGSLTGALWTHSTRSLGIGRFQEIVGAIFPALACCIGGALAAHWRQWR